MLLIQSSRLLRFVVIQPSCEEQTIGAKRLIKKHKFGKRKSAAAGAPDDSPFGLNVYVRRYAYFADAALMELAPVSYLW
jgi:hypothetical protein